MKNMKKVMIISFVVVFGFTTQAQNRVKEYKLLGEWEMKFDLNDKLSDREEADPNSMKEGFERTVKNFALSVVEDIDIKMDFRPNGELRMSANIFGVDRVEYTEWLIDRRGRLIIKEDSKKFRSGEKKIYVPGERDFWLMEGDRLVGYKRGYRSKKERKKELYMVRTQ